MAQISTVAALAHLCGEFPKLRCINKAHGISDFFRTSDLEALPLFKGTHEFSRLEQASGRAGVQPRTAPAHHPGCHTPGSLPPLSMSVLSTSHRAARDLGSPTCRESA